MDEKSKGIIYWIFKSNPRTFAALLSIAGAIGVAVITALGEMDWGVWQGVVMTALGSLGGVFTAWAGLETNAEADARKEREQNENEQ